MRSGLDRLQTVHRDILPHVVQEHLLGGGGVLLGMDLACPSCLQLVHDGEALSFGRRLGRAPDADADNHNVPARRECKLAQVLGRKGCVVVAANRLFDAQRRVHALVLQVEKCVEPDGVLANVLAAKVALQFLFETCLPLAELRHRVRGQGQRRRLLDLGGDLGEAYAVSGQERRIPVDEDSSDAQISGNGACML